MKTLMHAAILGSLALAGGQGLAAQEEARPRREGPPPAESPMPRFPREMAAAMMYRPSHLLDRRDALDLTTEQVTRLSALESELKLAREKAESDAAPHRQELRKLWEQSTPDVAQVRSHAQAAMQAGLALRLSGLTTAVQAKSVLTAEQRGRVQGWAQARGRMGRGRMGGAGGPDSPGFRDWRGPRRPGFRGPVER